MKTDTHFRSYLAHFFLEWELFHIEIVEKIKTHILCSITFFRKSRRLWDEEKFGRAGQDTDDNIIRCMRLACLIHTLRTCNTTYCPSTARLVTRSLLCYVIVQCLSCFAAQEQTDLTFLTASPHFFALPTLQSYNTVVFWVIPPWSPVHGRRKNMLFPYSGYERTFWESGCL